MEAAMARKSVTLLEGADEIAVIGDPVPAAAHRGRTRGLHTISIRLQGFRGLIYVEGSLEATPALWANVIPVLEFPEENIGAPVSDTFGYTFRGAYCWLRVRVDRSHLVPLNLSPEQIALRVGRVDRILLNC
jgi:hypothetical protein